MALNAEHLIGSNEILSRYVRLANGSKAHYMTAGQIGPAVVLLHGGIIGSSGMAGFRLMMPVLAAAGFRVFAPDRPGYGFSDTRPEYRTKTWLDDVRFVEMFAEALCLDKFHIGGNSMGTQCAIYYMVNNPDRIISAALVATGGIAGFAGVPADQHVRRAPNPNAPQFDGTAESMRALLDPIIWRKEGMTPDLLEMRAYAGKIQMEARSERATRSNTGTGTADDNNLGQWHDMGNRFSKLTLPIIYLHGMQDYSAPVENALLAEPYLPNIQFFYPDPCGHQGQTDQPDMFNAVFSEFLSDGKVSAKTAEWAGVSKNRAINPNLVEVAEGVRV